MSDINVNVNVGPELQSNYLATLIGAAVIAGITPAQLATGLITAVQGGAAAALAAHIADTVGAHAGSAVSYDNTVSGMTAATAQAAIDEVRAWFKDPDVTRTPTGYQPARIWTNPSTDPGAGNDQDNIAGGFRQGDFWINHSTGDLFYARTVASAAADWEKVAFV